MGDSRDMRKGFTLIELLTVVVIIGLLISLGGYMYIIAMTRSRDSQRMADLEFVGNALGQYSLDNRTYPEFQDKDHPSYPQPEATWQLEKLADDTAQKKPLNQYLAPKYLAKMPQDPAATCLIGVKNCTVTPEGRYLYYSLDKSGYYLMALMERVENVNYNVSVATELEKNGYPPAKFPKFCTVDEFNNPGCSQNYFITNTKTN